MIFTGDSLEVLRGMEDSSIDSVVTDPPYGLKFMGKKWDHDVPSVELWREVLRVLKPGGHLLSFGGTRTYHRMVVAIEDAGFEIRDQLQWIYGSGFPKSLDVSKAIDKAAGAEREVVGQQNYSMPDIRGNSYDQSHVADRERLGVAITAPASPEAIKWQGFGTALKPANEPIVLARKPLEKGLTVAANVLKWGVGGLNIDGCRIGDECTVTLRNGNSGSHGRYGKDDRVFERVNPPGRWPANVIFDEEAAQALDLQSGVTPSNFRKNKTLKKQVENTVLGKGLGFSESQGVNDSGGASRFFYCAKSSKSERNAGLEGIANGHPTVKPLKLMAYLVRLVTPPCGTVLDPFMGSGTTGVACKSEGFRFIGIELNPEYVEIAKRRIEGTS